MVIRLGAARPRRRLSRRVRKVMRRWKVWHRGQDITQRVFYLDGRRKVARCYVLQDGHPFIDLDTMRVVTEDVRHVRIVRHRGRRR